jgi:carboxyl-terminal processing protease
MRTRGIAAAAVLSCAIVSGGWLVQRGLVATGRTAPTKFDGARLFQQVLSRVSEDYVDSAAVKDIYRKAVDGLVLELGDPHSAYLTADRLSRLNETTTGRYAGVGVQIDIRDGWITVVTPLPDSPASDAGIRTGDRVVEIDGKSTHGWTSEEALKAMRGNPGTMVTLAIERFGATAPIRFTLARREIHIRSVQHALMLRDGVGYVDLLAFSDSAAPELRRQIDSLRRAGMTSLIFDLRGDPGGLLDQGVSVSDLFLDPGQDIVSMRGRTPEVSRDFRDRAPQPWPNLVLGVLVDSGSASAAEIVAGALQDHDRAVIIGTPTYGKGSAQTVFNVPGGGLKLTIAKWFTPSGRSIDRPHGPAVVTPDSLKAKLAEARFKTDSGRLVVGGGGIRPDVVVSDSALGLAALALTRAVGPHANDFRDVVTEYAMSLKGTGQVSGPDFQLTPEMRGEVQRRLAARKISIDSTTARTVAPILDRLLVQQIERYLFGTSAEFSRSLRDDKTVQRAIGILSSAKTQKEAIEKNGK